MKNMILPALACFVSAATAFGQQCEPHIRRGHNLLQENHSPAMTTMARVSDFSFRDVTSKPHHLQDSLARGPAVFVFMSTTCPLAKRYTTRLNRLHKSYAKRGVSFFAVFPNDDESMSSINKFGEAVKYPFPSIHDHDGHITKQLGATMTPQSFLIDSLGYIRYRGAIDDDRYENRVKERYLLDAIESLINNEPVKVRSKNAMGCTIHRDEKKTEKEVTYSGHIARILQNNCMSCHREGQVAPFALTNYEEAKRWKTELRKYTHSRLMPPWQASRGIMEYKNDASLTAQEIDLIDKWVRQGAPLGNKNQVPPAPKFNDDWAFGKPDLIVEMPKEYTIGPMGEDDYRHFVIPYEAVKDHFITAVDVRPGNRNVVHHVLAFFDTTGAARKLDAKDAGPGYSRFGDIGFEPTSVLGGWAPGKAPTRLPIGSGLWLPKKGDIVLQVHYYRTGVEEKDKTKIGFYLSKKPKTVPARTGVAENKRFVVPAGKADHKVVARYTLEEDSYITSVTPHMHLIGKKLKVIARRPDGKVTPLVEINNWDFNWQSTYYLKKLHEFPKGTVFEMTATYDNSADNPNNPNSPPSDIKWGDKTSDEMCLAFIGFLHKSEYAPLVKAGLAQVQGNQP